MKAEYFSADIQEFIILLNKFIIQFGRPPKRLDLLSTIDSVAFNEAWDSKKTEKIVIDNREYHLYYIGLDKLTQNKSKVGRNKDLDDLKYLKALIA